MRISDCSSAVCSSDLDDTSVLGLAADARPGNALIGVLLGDLGVELALDPDNAGDPVVALLAHLGDRLHPAHELREGLELGPLVVGRAHRHVDVDGLLDLARSEEHTSELQSLMRISYAVFCLKNKKTITR